MPTGSQRDLGDAIRKPLRRVFDSLLDSPRTPFALRSRLLWRKQQRSWIARRPSAFPEQVRWKMLKDRRPLLTTFADKVAARAYVASVAGPEYLTACYAVLGDPTELDPATLPRSFVAKVNHGSGGVWLVDDSAPPGLSVRGESRNPRPAAPGDGWNRVLARPDELDWELLVKTLGEWLRLRYTDRYVEWAYLEIEPRVLVEEYLAAPDGVPPDYKFFVFDGQARLVQVDTDRFGTHERNFYLPDWTPLEVECAWPRAREECPRPSSLAELLTVSEALGRETDFVRVDLYDVNGRVVFGELSNYPEGGTAPFAPQSFNLELGHWWRLPKKYGA